ncbi:hypothetical protein V1281_006764 [Nitrobacteraceae bacterium AZCC 2161]
MMRSRSGIDYDGQNLVHDIAGRNAETWFLALRLARYDP